MRRRRDRGVKEPPKRLWTHLRARRTRQIGIEVILSLYERPYDVTIVFFPDGVRMAYQPVAIHAERNDDLPISPNEVRRLPLTQLTKIAKALVPQVQARLVDPARRGGGSVEIYVDELDKAALRPERPDHPRNLRGEYEAFKQLYQRVEVECDGVKTNEEVARLEGTTANAVAQKKWRARNLYGLDI